MKNLLFAVSLPVIAIAAAVAPGSAHAVDTARYSMANAQVRCQGSLPAYEGKLRKSPVAVRNLATGGAFITCGFLADQSNTDVDSFGLYANTTSGADVTLNCTGVIGYDTGDITYVAKNVVLPADGSQESIYWDDADFGGEIDPSLPVSVNCLLPSGAGLNDMYFNYSEDVGL